MYCVVLEVLSEMSWVIAAVDAFSDTVIGEFECEVPEASCLLHDSCCLSRPCCCLAPLEPVDLLVEPTLGCAAAIDPVIKTDEL
jgi:hypothetical protein